MKKAGSASMFNLICALLMAALLVCQFLPFWTVEEETVSISAYVWFPSNHNNVTKMLEAEFEGYSINNLIAGPVLVLVLGAAGLVLCVLKREYALTALMPAACGAAGLWGYLSKPYFRLGEHWMLHVALCAAMLIVAVVSLATNLRKSKA